MYLILLLLLAYPFLMLSMEGHAPSFNMQTIEDDQHIVPSSQDEQDFGEYVQLSSLFDIAALTYLLKLLNDSNTVDDIATFGRKSFKEIPDEVKIRLTVRARFPNAHEWIGPKRQMRSLLFAANTPKMLEMCLACLGISKKVLAKELFDLIAQAIYYPGMDAIACTLIEQDEYTALDSFSKAALIHNSLLHERPVIFDVLLKEYRTHLFRLAKENNLETFKRDLQLLYELPMGDEQTDSTAHHDILERLTMPANGDSHSYALTLLLTTRGQLYTTKFDELIACFSETQTDCAIPQAFIEYFTQLHTHYMQERTDEAASKAVIDIRAYYGNSEEFDAFLRGEPVDFSVMLFKHTIFHASINAILSMLKALRDAGNPPQNPLEMLALNAIVVKPFRRGADLDLLLQELDINPQHLAFSDAVWKRITRQRGCSSFFQFAKCGILKQFSSEEKIDLLLNMIYTRSPQVIETALNFIMKETDITKPQFFVGRYHPLHIAIENAHAAVGTSIEKDFENNYLTIAEIFLKNRMAITKDCHSRYPFAYALGNNAKRLLIKYDAISDNDADFKKFAYQCKTKPLDEIETIIGWFTPEQLNRTDSAFATLTRKVAVRLLTDQKTDAQFLRTFFTKVTPHTQVKFHGNTVTLLMLAIAKDSPFLTDTRSSRSFDLLRYRHISQNMTNRRDTLGNTALHWASCKNNANTVQRLLDLGCDPSIENDEGIMAADYAKNSRINSTIA